jgi:hypothetical protein
MSDPQAPSAFAPLAGESPRAFAAFVAYRDLGPGRSAAEAYRQRAGRAGAKQASGRWNAWAAQFSWQARAAAHDAHLERMRQQAWEAEAAKEAAKWERRRQEALERGWEASQALRSKAEAMLETPLFRERVEDGVTVREPAKWTFDTMVRVARLAVELEVAVLTAMAKDPAEMSDAELAAVIAAGAAEITPDEGATGS